MTTLLLLVVNAFLLLLYLASRPRRARVSLYLPDFYLGAIFIYFIGAFSAEFFDGIADAQSLEEMALVALGSGLLGAIFAAILFARDYPENYFLHNLVNENSGPVERIAIRLGLIVSVAVSILFVVMTFLNSATAGFLSVGAVFNELGTMSGLRKTITTGSQGYFAPGYIKQFRDIMAPIFLVALSIIAANPNARPQSRLFVFGSIGIVLFAIMIAGLRSEILILLGALFLGNVFANRIKQHHNPLKSSWWHRQKTNSVIIFGFLLYLLLSILLGRIGSDISIWKSFSNVFITLAERIVLTVPRENAATFFFWGRLGPTDGTFWLDELASVLPGIRTSGLSNHLHNLNGGSLDGNSPLGLPADVWMAWGWTGLYVVPGMYGAFIAFFDYVLSRNRSPVFFGIKVFLAFALLKIYSPFGFLLYGGGTSVILVVIVIMLRNNASQNAGNRAGTPIV